jgi:hypothetical protein
MTESGNEFVKQLMDVKRVHARYGHPPSDHKVKTANGILCTSTSIWVGSYCTPDDIDNAEFLSGSETLYQSAEGAYFLQVVSDWGGAPGGYLLEGRQAAAGYCIIQLDDDEAVEWAEHRGEVEALDEHKKSSEMNQTTTAI